jgi:Domain of Unknown Function (DUF1259)
MIATRKAVLLFVLLSMPCFSAAQGLNTTAIDQALGRSGSMLGDSYKIGFPRTDLRVKLDGVLIKPGFALGSWVAFSGTDSNATVMGDLTLLQEEVNPVMAKLREGGIQVTALHNHLLNERPHVMYMHYMGKGKAADLAKSLLAALRASETPLGKPAEGKAEQEPEFVKTVEEVLGRKGAVHGGVLGYGIARGDIVTLNGTLIVPAMGVAEGINFQEAGKGKVATTGDFVLTADEVNPVISALEAHNIQVTALHNHMLEETPRLFFMHFWAVGTAESVAGGIKAALEKVHLKN